MHVAQAENQRFPYEVILRSVLKHLVDAASNEFLFLVDFFKTQPKDTFNRIFGRTLSLILENIENYLLNCSDMVGLLIMIKVTQYCYCLFSLDSPMVSADVAFKFGPIEVPVTAYDHSHAVALAPSFVCTVPHCHPQMTHALRMVMQRRRIPVLDALFDRIAMLLWPRFKQVFDANLKSIKGANAKKLGPVDVSPHYVSR